MKITVFGATGRIGGEVVRQALGSGHHVTAVVRESSRFALGGEGLEVLRVAALDDPDAVADAVAGRDAVLSGIGPRGRRDAGVTAPATRTILDAMARGEGHRILVVSAQPLGPVPEDDSFFMRRIAMPAVSRILRPVYDDLREMEDDLALSDTEWTAVRPPQLVDRPVTGAYRTAVGANLVGGHKISRADVAHAMLAMVEDRATFRRSVGVAW